MATKRPMSTEEARNAGIERNLDWSKADLEQFSRNLEVEFEPGALDPSSNVTNDDLVCTGKFAWAHLKEYHDYYTRLDTLEAEADDFWAARR